MSRKTIREVISHAINYTEENLGTQKSAHNLTDELCAALKSEGYWPDARWDDPKQVEIGDVEKVVITVHNKGGQVVGIEMSHFEHRPVITHTVLVEGEVNPRMIGADFAASASLRASERGETIIRYSDLTIKDAEQFQRLQDGTVLRTAPGEHVRVIRYDDIVMLHSFGYEVPASPLDYHFPMVIIERGEN